MIERRPGGSGDDGEDEDQVGTRVARWGAGSAEGARRRALEEFVTPAVAERAHVDVDVISSCEQTAADARAHRREAPHHRKLGTGDELA